MRACSTENAHTGQVDGDVPDAGAHRLGTGWDTPVARRNHRVPLILMSLHSGGQKSSRPPLEDSNYIAGKEFCETSLKVKNGGDELFTRRS